jgi:flagellin-like hook-associated protein FlgL
MRPWVLLTLACACGGSSAPPTNKTTCMKSEAAQPMVQPIQDAITQSDAAGTSAAATALAMSLMDAEKTVVTMTTVQHDIDDALTQIDQIVTDVGLTPPDFASAQDAMNALQTQMDELSSDCALVLCP